jgi:hypothetical protein
MPVSSADFRRMVMLTETAALLESRAAAAPPAQALPLRGRADKRRREAESIRTRRAAAGVALPAGQVRSRVLQRLGSLSTSPSSA